MAQFEKRRFRPAQLVSRLEAQCAWLFKAIDHHRSRQALAERELAKTQYLASWEAKSILDQAGELVEDAEAGCLGAVEIAGLAAWRMTKGVFRFDPGLWERLTAADVNPEMAGYVLRRLPQWCIYVEVEGRLAPYGVEGVWAFVEFDDGEPAALHLILDGKSRLRHVPISLAGPMEIAVRAATQTWLAEPGEPETNGDVMVARRVVSGTASVVEATVRMLTYLCCANASVGERGRLPQNPMPVRAGSGWAMFPADRPTLWRVGAGGAQPASGGLSPNERSTGAGRFDVRKILRKGGVEDQEVVWVDGTRSA